MWRPSPFVFNNASIFHFSLAQAFPRLFLCIHLSGNPLAIMADEFLKPNCSRKLLARGWEAHWYSPLHRHYYCLSGASATQWEVPLNPTVGHGLLLGASKHDVVGFAGAVESLARNELLPIMVALVGHLTKYGVKTFSHHGGCRKPGNGEFLDAGNFAYAAVWLRLKDSPNCFELADALQSRWPRLSEDSMSSRATEFKGDVIETIFALWDKMKQWPVDAPTAKQFRDCLELASTAASRLSTHVPRGTSVVQFLAALDIAQKAFAAPTPRNATGDRKLQMRKANFSAQLAQCFMK
jgi:hypothetical protein